MKKAHPAQYRIAPGEQAGRLTGIARAAAGALRPGPGPLGDRLLAPFFLTLWYGGLLAGYLRGPAWTDRSGRGNP
jgi:hypothetical protein